MAGLQTGDFLGERPLADAIVASHLRGAVLVVDDDARLAEITARGLRRLGFDADSSSRLRAWT